MYLSQLVLSMFASILSEFAIAQVASCKNYALFFAILPDPICSKVEYKSVIQYNYFELVPVNIVSSFVFLMALFSLISLCLYVIACRIQIQKKKGDLVMC